MGSAMELGMEGSRIACNIGPNGGEEGDGNELLSVIV